MSLDLSTLVFKTETSDLERASKALGDVVINMSKLDKASKDAARTEATLAKAAKDNASANLSNARAEQINEKAISSKTKALNDQNGALSGAERLLLKTRDAIGFMTDGLSRGQASQTAYLKSLGATSDQIEEFIKLKQLERKLIGKDTFDDSQQGLLKLKNAYSELRESVRQYGADSGLTSKQTRELARDKERLIESMKAQGASFLDIRKAVRAHNEEYVKLAAQYNTALTAEEAVIKGRKDAVNATNYLTQADQKMAAALNISNVSLDKAGTDSLVRYEAALRKSGISQELATQKLATYKMQLNQVAGLEEKRRAQHLARALTPQVSDVVVSLWSGQAPMTVLLQQGAQINDLFQLSGVAAQDFAKTVRAAMASMLPAILTVAKGIGGVIVSGFYDAGKGVTNFIGNVTGMNKVLQHTDDLLYLVGGRAVNFSKFLHTMTAAANIAFAGALFAGVAILASLAVGLKQVITENDQLAKTLAISGGQLGLSHNAAIQYANSMELTGVSTGEAIKVISEMAKAGNLGKDSINMITRAAIDMEAYAGVSIEDTVKAFSKFKEKPVEALVELAKQTGLVSEEVLKSVRTLQEQGDQLGASSLAMESYADVTRQQAARIKEDYNGLSLFFKELGKSIGDYWDGIFKNLFRLPSQTEALEASFGIVKDKLTKAKATVDLAGPDFATSRQKQEVKDLEEQVRLIGSQIGSSVRVSGEGQRVVSNNIADVKANEQAAALRAKYATTEQQSLAEITKLRKQEELWKKAGLLTDERRLIIESGIVAEQKKIDKSREHKSSTSENYYATLMREATNNTIAADNATKELTKSEQKLLEIKSDSRFAKLSAIEKANVEAKYAGSIASERAAEATKKEVEADELKSKLLGKASGLGKEYYSTLEQIQKYNKEGVYSDNEVQQLTEALYKATPAYRENIKQVEELNAKLLEYKQAAMDSDAAIFADNRSIEHRLSLIGLTTEEQRLATVEYERQNKLSKVSLELEKQKLKIQKDFADNPVKRWELEMQAERIASEQTSAINREAAIPQDKGDNWLTGAKNALDKYRDEAQNVAKSTEDLFSKAFKGMEDALVDFVKTGKLDFASLADSIIADLIRIQIQQSVMPGLSAGLNAGASWVASLFSANGNAFDTSGQVQKFAKGGTFTNQIVDQPTPFKFAKGTGIMGEAGPEAIMPLTRGADGNLGVRASGGTSGNSIIVNVIESPGNGGQQSRRTENGVDILDVFVEKVKSSIATDINRGSGAVPNAMANTYGLNRVAGAY